MYVIEACLRIVVSILTPGLGLAAAKIVYSIPIAQMENNHAVLSTLAFLKRFWKCMTACSLAFNAHFTLSWVFIEFAKLRQWKKPSKSSAYKAILLYRSAPSPAD